jgi:hypothetical protein
MPLFPNQSEVLVSPYSKEEVIVRLNKVTRDVNFLDYEARKANGYSFNGTFEEDRFRVSLVIDKADSFLPLIKGKVESTPIGCILFLEYRLFPSSAFFLAFWSGVTLLMGLFFGFLADKPGYAVLSLALGLGNYLFAWFHLRRKVKVSQKIFYGLLNN